jgi:hypothetical protein
MILFAAFKIIMADSGAVVSVGETGFGLLDHHRRSHQQQQDRL